MKAAIYARISLDRAGQSESPERQIGACQDLATAKGWGVARADIYVDRDLSAYKQGVIRPDYDRLLAVAEAGKFDVVLAYRLDRLSRSVQESLRLADRLNKCGVNLTLVTGEVDTTTAMGRAFFQISAVMAELEAATTAERLSLANAAAARAGRPHAGGSRCYGYTRDGQLIQEEAVYLRKAAELLQSGTSLRQTARELNEAGSMTTQDNPWQPRTLYNCLSSPRLRGVRIHHDELYKGDWDPVFSEDQHRELLRVLSKGYSESPDRVTNHYLLTGFILCGRCGQSMGTITQPTPNGKKYTKYMCRNTPGTKNCGRVAISVKQPHSW